EECKNQLSRIREQFIEEIRGPAGTDFILQKMEECEVLQRSLMIKLEMDEKLRIQEEKAIQAEIENEKKTKQLAQLESNYEQMIKQNEQLEKDIQLLKENRKKQQEYFETELKKQKEKIEMLEKEKQNAAQKQMDLMKVCTNLIIYNFRK